MIYADPALGTRLLKYVNSLHVGVDHTIGSVEEVASIMGIEVIWQLVLGISILTNSRAGSCKNFNYAIFWSESSATAFSSTLLSKKYQHILPEEAFVLGLLHQIGVSGIANIYPDQYSVIYPTLSALCDKQWRD